MIKLEYLKKGVKLPKVDYVLDKPEKLSDLISVNFLMTVL